MPRQVGTLLLYGLPRFFVFVFSFVIVLVFVLTERSAIVLVFVFVFVTKIALVCIVPPNSVLTVEAMLDVIYGLQAIFMQPFFLS